MKLQKIITLSLALAVAAPIFAKEEKPPFISKETKQSLGAAALFSGLLGAVCVGTKLTANGIFKIIEGSYEIKKNLYEKAFVKNQQAQAVLEKMHTSDGALLDGKLWQSHGKLKAQSWLLRRAGAVMGKVPVAMGSVGLFGYLALSLKANERKSRYQSADKFRR